jgi:hypothetical protein
MTILRPDRQFLFVTVFPLGSLFQSHLSERHNHK